MYVQQSIDIGAPPEKVWGVMTDVERWHEWTESITSIEKLDDGPLAVGSRARIKQPRLPAIVWTVTELTPGEAFTWESRSRGVHSVATHRVTTRAGGSTVALSIRQSGLLAAIFGPLFAGMTRRYVDMEARGLKSHCEAPA